MYMHDTCVHLKLQKRSTSDCNDIILKNIGYNMMGRSCFWCMCAERRAEDDMLYSVWS